MTIGPRVKRGTTAQWAAADAAGRFLLFGELGWDWELRSFRIGANPPAPWATLPDANEPPLTVVKVFRSTGDIALSVVANQWTDTDPSGNAAARDLDMVIPAKVGDWVQVTPHYLSLAAATNVWQDIAVITGNGVVTHRFSEQTGGGGGLMGWFMLSSATIHAQGGPPARYQVQAGDVVNGTVRLRHQHQNKAATARSISAAGNNRFTLEGSGPFR